MPFVRWVGDPDPVDENPDRIKGLIAAGKLTKEDVWAYNAKKRQIVIEGYTVRILTPREGLSQSYQWGPERGSYVQFVTDRDWKRIQALPEARTFALALEMTG